MGDDRGPAVADTEGAEGAEGEGATPRSSG